MRWILAVSAALMVLQLVAARPSRQESSPQFDFEFPGDDTQRPGSRPIRSTTPPTRSTTPPTRPPSTRPTTSAPAQGSTVAACNCPSTPEYNPVCGSNNMTYDNPGKLKCANICGLRVEVSFYGSCPTTTTAAPSTQT